MLDAALSVRGAACATCACRRWSFSSPDMMDKGVEDRASTLYYGLVSAKPRPSNHFVEEARRGRRGGGDKLVTCPHGTLRSRFPRSEGQNVVFSRDLMFWTVILVTVILNR